MSSSFAGCYGGPIANGPLRTTEIEQLYRSVRTWRYGQFQVHGNPIAPIEVIPLHKAKVVEDFTHILELNGDFDAVVSRFSRGNKSSLSQGLRMGVSVRVASTLDDYRTYYGAYQDSLRRWAERTTRQYPWRLFEKGFQLSQEYPELIKLWLAEVSDKVVAGAWVFYWNQCASFWHGAAYEEFFHYHPNNVLQSRIIRDAIERQIRYYDLHPSGGQEGVAHFKERFGASQKIVKRGKIVNPILEAIQKFAGQTRRGARA